MQNNKVGRPLKFQSVKELNEKIEQYFNTTPKDEWTITGLALHLDTFRSVLCDYEKIDDRCEFSNTIKKAKQRVENGYEIDLKKFGRSGTIFALKNFDWRDKTEQDLTTNGKDLPTPLLNAIRKDDVRDNDGGQ
jgi:hypothetical protein